MPKIKDENYYVIHGWMLNQLDLKGVQLQIYAIIYGFSQCEDVEFSGSLSYLCEFTGTSKPTVIKALNDLQEKGLISKREEKINGVQFNRYSILPLVKKFNGGSKETLPEVVKNLNGGSKETLPNNIRDNINIKNNKKKGKRKATEVAYTPTLQELEERFSIPLSKAVLDWLTYKNQRGDNYTPLSLKALLTRIENNANDNGEQAVINLIQLCIENNWKGIIWDRLNKAQDNYNPSQQSSTGNPFADALLMAQGGN